MVLTNTVAAFAYAAIFSTPAVYGHGVCALMSCDALEPCYPLTIIKECGIPTPSLHNYEDAITSIIVIAVVLSVALFVFNRYYLKRMDFYLVR